MDSDACSNCLSSVCSLVGASSWLSLAPCSPAVSLSPCSPASSSSCLSFAPCLASSSWLSFAPCSAYSSGGLSVAPCSGDSSSWLSLARCSLTGPPPPLITTRSRCRSPPAFEEIRTALDQRITVAFWRDGGVHRRGGLTCLISIPSRSIASCVASISISVCPSRTSGSRKWPRSRRL